VTTTAGGSFHGNLSSGSGGYLSRGEEGTRDIEVDVFGTGRRPLLARYARTRCEGDNAADECGVEVCVRESLAREPRLSKVYPRISPSRQHVQRHQHSFIHIWRYDFTGTKDTSKRRLQVRTRVPHEMVTHSISTLDYSTNTT
jgi:hypothetical protein